MDKDEPKDDYITKICKPGTAAACRYLLFGGFEGGYRFACGKHEPGFRAIVAEKTAEGRMRAKGDNCEGFPINQVIGAGLEPDSTDQDQDKKPGDPPATT